MKDTDMSKSILLKNGRMVNPLKRNAFAGDMRISGGVISETADSIRTEAGDSEIDVSGKLVMPGLVDVHVHISHCPDGHFMLAKAGVTTTLDVAGTPEEMLGGFRKCGCGLTLGFLYPLIPGKTIPSGAPSCEELERIISYALENGALGVKILGGHYPLTGEATRNAIKIAHRKRAWIAVHAGSVETPGDIRGMEDLVQLAENRPLHIAHINSYCRGSNGGSPLDEAKRAIDALKKAPNARSESYLAPINGTSGKLKDGVPASEVTKRSLVHGGYSADAEGMRKAIIDGWARIHYHDAAKREIVLMPPEKAFDYYMGQGTDVMMSFAVNSPVSALPIALAKDGDGRFIVDALATDGGAIPRNVTLRQGLCLVRFGALTLSELAYKASLAPARMLGLDDRGHLEAGAVADVIVVNPDSFEVEIVVASGRVIYKDGSICGTGGSFITTVAGERFFKNEALRHAVVSPGWLNVNA